MNNRNPKRRVVPGQRFESISASVWNWAVDQYQRADQPGYKTDRATGTVVDVQNLTGGPLPHTFSVVQVNGPVIGPLENLAEFCSTSQVWASTPSPDSGTIAIIHDPLSDGAVGRATIMGLVPCMVDLVDVADTYAGPASTTEYLVSGTSGPAKIVWVQGDDGTGRATGLQWALVLLGGDAGGGSGGTGGSGPESGWTMPYQTVSVADATTGIGDLYRAVMRTAQGRPAEWPFGDRIWLRHANSQRLYSGWNYDAALSEDTYDNGDGLLEVWDAEGCCGSFIREYQFTACCPDTPVPFLVEALVVCPDIPAIDGRIVQMLVGNQIGARFEAWTVNSFTFLFYCGTFGWTLEVGHAAGIGPCEFDAVNPALVPMVGACQPFEQSQTTTVSGGGCADAGTEVTFLVRPVTFTPRSGTVTLSYTCTGTDVPMTLYDHLTVTGGTDDDLDGETIMLTYQDMAPGGEAWWGFKEIGGYAYFSSLVVHGSGTPGFTRTFSRTPIDGTLGTSQTFSNGSVTSDCGPPLLVSYETTLGDLEVTHTLASA